MSDYEEQFKSLGLPSSTPVNYQGPEQYARAFKKCTILDEHNVSYSSDTTQCEEQTVYGSSSSTTY